MNPTAHVLKVNFLLITGIMLFSVSCKKNNEGPFIAPVALQPADLGVYSFVADWGKVGPAVSYNLFVATDTGFTQTGRWQFGRGHARPRLSRGYGRFRGLDRR